MRRILLRDQHQRPHGANTQTHIQELKMAARKLPSQVGALPTFFSGVSRPVVIRRMIPILGSVSLRRLRAVSDVVCRRVPVPSAGSFSIASSVTPRAPARRRGAPGVVSLFRPAMLAVRASIDGDSLVGDPLSVVPLPATRENVSRVRVMCCSHRACALAHLSPCFWACLAVRGTNAGQEIWTKAR